MSLTPGQVSTPEEHNPGLEHTIKPATSPWSHAVFACISLALGMYLIVYPWTDNWNLNHLPAYVRLILPGGELASGLYPNVEDVWDDPFFRSAFTCLGLLNIWTAIRQIAAMFRAV
jgi:hypothetical protein